MDKFESFLQFALKAEAEPDRKLNEKIMGQLKEEEKMSKWNIKKAVAVAAMCVVVLSVSGITAYAAWNYLHPQEVAEKVGDKKLSRVFEDKKATLTQETQTKNGYVVTMLGVVSGKDISDACVKGDEGEIMDDRSYIVTAIAKEDGTDMNLDEAEDTVYVSPYIRGQNPAKVNLFHMNGGHASFVENGVYYRLIDCNNLEIFANRGVYLGVSDQRLNEAEQYDFDEATGEIRVNKGYKGLNLLFEVPMDPAKADEAAARKKIKEWEAFWAADDENDDEPVSDGGNFRAEKWTPETIAANAEIIADTVKTVTPDAKGYIDYKWSACGMEGEGKILLSWDEYETGRTYAITTANLDDSGEKDLIETCTKNEDGTVTMAIYKEK